MRSFHFGMLCHFTLYLKVMLMFLDLESRDTIIGLWFDPRKDSWVTWVNLNRDIHSELPKARSGWAYMFLSPLCWLCHVKIVHLYPRSTRWHSFARSWNGLRWLWDRFIPPFFSWLKRQKLKSHRASQRILDLRYRPLIFAQIAALHSRRGLP